MSMIRMAFIRHGETTSNEIGVFAGRTDYYPLTEKSVATIRENAQKYPYPEVEHIYRSPASRCLATAQLIYPGRDYDVVQEVWEIDFGDAEDMYSGDAFKLPGVDGQKFIDHDPDFAFPNGERFGDFMARAFRGMDIIVRDAKEKGYENVAVITHSMLMDNFFHECSVPPLTHEERSIPNGMGVTMLVDPDEWLEKRVMRFERLIPAGAPRGSMEDSPYVVPRPADA